MYNFELIGIKGKERNPNRDYLYLYDECDTMIISEQLEALITLALVDNELSNFEKRAIYSLGQANGLEEQEIEAILRKILRQKELDTPILTPMTDDDKFDFLHSIVRLMKIDKKVYLSEIRFCEDMAVKLGYKRKAVSELSARVFSDPSLISDRNELQSLMDNYKLNE